MFNSPILDVAIGLAFIFLLYSLLATSIKEAIATAFAFRARMLKTAITEKMLTCKDKETAKSRWSSIWKGIYEFLQQTLFIITGNLKERENNLGTYFYDHPVIKGYGASRVFPNPSYIPNTDFSTIVIEILKKDFADKLTNIAQYKLGQDKNGYSIDDVMKDLQLSGDAAKIKALFDYYAYHYTVLQLPPPSVVIDKETLYILQMHLQKGIYNIDAFGKQLENWFDQTMNRVSGWYKRQVQVILFFLGIVLAILFNVDIITIVNKLSSDKDARNKLVEVAVQSADKYKDDPRVKKMDNPQTFRADSTANMKIYTEYNNKLDSAKTLINGDITSANGIIALGYGDYGKSDTAFIDYLKTKNWYFLFFKLANLNAEYNKISIHIDSLSGAEDTLNSKPALKRTAFYNQQVKDHQLRLKTAYVWYMIKKHPKKILGFTILAFAVCLGAPFWFDLLNKLVNLRGSGKKEDSANAKTTAAQQQPLTINVNSQQTGEGAVG